MHKERKHLILLTNFSGFTLIELIVVISIIVFLFTIVLASTQEVRQKAKIAKAKHDVQELRLAVEELLNDTGKYPGGCPPDILDGDLEVYFNASIAGLLQVPPVGTVWSNICAWTADEVAKWGGPYISYGNVIDPWGQIYYLDYDYHGASGYPGNGPGCPSLLQDGIVILSTGPNGIQYDCDDIVNYLKVL